MFKLSSLLLLTLLFASTPSNIASALEDDLQKSTAIAAHGIKVQSQRIKVAAENLANEDSTGQQAGDKPYTRKVLFAKNRFDKGVKSNVVRTKKIAPDTKSPFIRKYEPYHPAADEDGYVDYPNVYKEIEMADLREAQVSYEANLSVIEMSKNIMQRTIEAIK